MDAGRGMSGHQRQIEIPSCVEDPLFVAYFVSNPFDCPLLSKRGAGMVNLLVAMNSSGRDGILGAAAALRF